MHTVRLASETDLDGWRSGARALRAAGVAPSDARFLVGGDQGLLEAPLPVQSDGSQFKVPRAFVDLCANVALHRNADRFDLLYRLLLRLAETPDLLKLVTDDDVALARRYEKGVLTAIHKMHAFVRFRRVDGGGPDEDEQYAAWFEPRAYVLERAAPYFIDRLANVVFTILTPYASAFWNRTSLVIGPGASADDVPEEDAAEDDWRAYFAAIFNPARLNERAMTRHMPKAYWRNLPEARDIGALVKSAPERAVAMVAADPTDPAPIASRLAARRAAAPPPGTDAAPPSLPAVVAALASCSRCDLYRDATQPVPGWGPAGAAMMLVGEQPGDAEDLRGRPFVGPAGLTLNNALETAGIDRDRCYVTNAVKHFKHELRGKRRIHRTPDASETKACRWWLDAELRLVKPKVVVALGGTAAAAVLGRPVQVLRERGPAGRLDDGALVFITVHPSYLLRIPEPRAKEVALAAFILDLRNAARAAEAA